MLLNSGLIAGLDDLVTCTGKATALSGLSLNGITDHHASFEGGLSNGAEQIAEEALSGPEDHGVMQIARTIIPDRDRDGRYISPKCRREQAGVKAFDAAIRMNSPFRKDTDELAALEQRGHSTADAPSRRLAATLDEQGPGQMRQNADQRPAADFGLGYQPDRPDRMEYNDIQPADVVRDHQTCS